MLLNIFFTHIVYREYGIIIIALIIIILVKQKEILNKEQRDSQNK